jgi:hypothetical protein
MLEKSLFFQDLRHVPKLLVCNSSAPLKKIMSRSSRSGYLTMLIPITDETMPNGGLNASDLTKSNEHPNRQERSQKTR